jgi:aryl-alcohol dehydrogenase-like predicted oxidoreductase
VEFVLRYTLAHPGVSTIIVGTADTGHLQDNVTAALRGPLPPDVLQEAGRRLNAVGVAPRERATSDG